jgi:hypothetical protein
MADDEKTQAEEQRRKAAESLREHDRMTAQAGQGDKSAPYQAGAELDGNYTVQESRDRAAHIPGLHEREGKPSPFTERELAARAETESYVKAESANAGLTPAEWEHREQERDSKESEGKSTKGGKDGMTPEQQERVDQSLKNANVQRESMGGASDVSSKPTPNDPNQMDKAREVGQDLNKSGVTMDKE